MERKGRLDARIILLHETLALEEVEQLLNMMELSLDWDEGVRFAPTPSFSQLSIFRTGQICHILRIPVFLTAFHFISNMEKVTHSRGN